MGQIYVCHGNDTNEIFPNFFLQYACLQIFKSLTGPLIKQTSWESGGHLIFTKNESPTPHETEQGVQSSFIPKVDVWNSKNSFLLIFLT